MIIGTNPLHQFGHRQQASRFSDRPLAMDPFGFDGIEPRALAGQPTATFLFNPAIMSFNPVPDLVAEMPGGVIPNEKQRSFALASEVGQQPSQKGGGHRTNRPALDKAQQHLVESWQIQPITSDGFALRVLTRHLLLAQAQRLLVGPAMELGLPFSAPPDLIFKAQGNVRVVLSQPDQPVALLFFNS